MRIARPLVTAACGMLLTALISSAVVAGDQSKESPESVAVLAAHVANLREAEPGLLTGGQPDTAAWQMLAEQGVTSVINLRTDAEMNAYDEAAVVAAAGMDYLQIPVAGADGVNRANARLLWEAIAGADGKVLVHCASGNRVGALLAIGAAETRDLTPEQAIAYGHGAGLTRLEPRVREVLANPPNTAIGD